MEGDTGFSNGYQDSFEGIPKNLPASLRKIPVPPTSFTYNYILSYKSGIANTAEKLTETAISLQPQPTGTANHLQHQLSGPANFLQTPPKIFSYYLLSTLLLLP